MLSDGEIEGVRARVDLRALAVDLGAAFRGRARYGRCPICGGGPSAARFEILRDGRRWVCAVCNDGGDAITLVMRVKGVGFRDAIAALGGPLALSEAEKARLDAKTAAEREAREREAEVYRERERRALYAVWRGALPLLGSPAEAYLRRRGIGWRLDALALRCAERPYFEGETIGPTGRREPREIYGGPAMLAAFVDAEGHFRGLHQTWIDLKQPDGKAVIVDPDSGELLPAKKMRGSKAGCYLRLLAFETDRAELVCGEGIESTLSVRDTGVAAAFRAAGDLGNLAGRAASTLPHPSLKTPRGGPQRVPGPDPDFDSAVMPIPPDTRMLTLVKDGDSDPFLTELAMRRAARRHARAGLTIRVMDPPPGLDFNDVLRASA